MKKLILFVCAMVLCNISFSQIEIEKYGEFKLAAHQRPLCLFSNVSTSGGPRFFVQVAGGGDVSEFYFPNAESFKNFLYGLEETIPIYEDWSQICEKESLRFIMKNTGVRQAEPRLVFSLRGKMYITGGIRLNPMFYVDADGKCYIVVETVMLATEKCDELGDYRLFGYDVSFSSYESVTNADTRCQLIFSSSQEIKYFTTKLRDMLKLCEENDAMAKLLNR